MTEDAIRKVREIGVTAGVDQRTYIIEECSELITECSGLIKTLTKNERGKFNNEAVIDEALDVFTTLLIFFDGRGVTRETIRDHIVQKCGRAIERYNTNQEV